MSKTRPRPWRNPTPLRGHEPDWKGQFDTFDDWVNHATRALTNNYDEDGEELQSICIDAKGRRCTIGKHFMRARDEDAFPVRYFFRFKPVKHDRDQIARALLAAEHPNIQFDDDALMRDRYRGLAGIALTIMGCDQEAT
jgi:hypothetical protein